MRISLHRISDHCSRVIIDGRTCGLNLVTIEAGYAFAPTDNERSLMQYPLFPFASHGEALMWLNENYRAEHAKPLTHDDPFE